MTVWRKLFRISSTIAGEPASWDEALWATASSENEAIALMDTILEKHAYNRMEVEEIGPIEKSNRRPPTPRAHVYGQVVKIHELTARVTAKYTEQPRKYLMDELCES